MKKQQTTMELDSSLLIWLMNYVYKFILPLFLKCIGEIEDA
jgi:fucose 4-O-acetylase-like acetyltransferase